MYNWLYYYNSKIPKEKQYFSNIIKYVLIVLITCHKGKFYSINYHKITSITF